MPPRSKVRLRSKHHLVPPPGYQVSELVPKFLHRWRGDREVLVVPHLDAVPDHTADLNSVYWSEEFELPGPRNQERESRYKPRFAGGFDPGFPVEAAEIRCCGLFIDEMQRRRLAQAHLVPAVSHAGTKAALGKVGGEYGSVTTYRAETPVDPEVKVSLLQGTELASHLIAVAASFTETFTSIGNFEDFLGGNVTAYFGENSLPSDEVRTKIGPADPLWIEVGAPISDDLRTAFAVVVTIIDTGESVVSDPLFLTSIRGDIIATDIPVELLSPEATDVLRELDEERGDVSKLAARQSWTTEEAWEHVVAATVELGATSVDEAVAFVSFTLTSPTNERVLVY